MKKRSAAGYIIIRSRPRRMISQAQIEENAAAAREAHDSYHKAPVRMTRDDVEYMRANMKEARRIKRSTGKLPDGPVYE